VGVNGKFLAGKRCFGKSQSSSINLVSAVKKPNGIQRRDTEAKMWETRNKKYQKRLRPGYCFPMFLVWGGIGCVLAGYWLCIGKVLDVYW